MKQLRSEAGFSLVELLAVVLILSVLSAVAVPLYLDTRKTAAARTCEANIAAIASAESAYALRHGDYTATLDDLVGASEGLAELPTCPLTGTMDYQIATDGTSGDITISCTHADAHNADTDEPTTRWSKVMKKPTPDSYTPGVTTVAP